MNFNRHTKFHLFYIVPKNRRGTKACWTNVVQMMTSTLFLCTSCKPQLTSSKNRWTLAMCLPWKDIYYAILYHCFFCFKVAVFGVVKCQLSPLHELTAPAYICSKVPTAYFSAFHVPHICHFVLSWWVRAIEKTQSAVVVQTWLHSGIYLVVLILLFSKIWKLICVLGNGLCFFNYFLKVCICSSKPCICVRWVSISLSSAFLLVSDPQVPTVSCAEIVFQVVAFLRFDRLRCCGF